MNILNPYILEGFPEPRHASLKIHGPIRRTPTGKCPSAATTMPWHPPCRRRYSAENENEPRFQDVLGSGLILIRDHLPWIYK